MDMKKYVGLAILVAVLATAEGNYAAKAECCEPCANWRNEVVYNNPAAAATRAIGGWISGVFGEQRGYYGTSY